MVRGSLRDRARVIRKTSESQRTRQGGYVKRDEPGPWFRCNYDSGDEAESRFPGGTRRRRAGATLTTSTRALDGSSIDIKASDALEIDSQTHGELRLDVVGTPERLTHGRQFIGFYVDLSKVAREASG